MKISVYQRNRLISGICLMLISISLMGTGPFSDLYAKDHLVQHERSVSAFEAIEVGSAFKVFLTQGSTQKVVVEAAEDIMDLIQTKVKGKTLIISISEPIRDAGEMNIYITFEMLKRLDVSGASKVKTENRLKLDDLEIDCSGAARLNLALSARTMKIDCSGASNIELAGAANELKIDISGASVLDAVQFETESLVAEISGASKANVNVKRKLSAEISGAGSLKYMGNPEIIKTDVSGAARIKKMQ